MGDTVVNINQLVKRYRENVAVDHFSLDVKKGEILGLLGRYRYALIISILLSFLLLGITLTVFRTVPRFFKIYCKS